MKEPRVYLDWNATAPLRPEAREAMVAAFGVAGNPSSIHAEGRAARALVEAARADVAALVGCAPDEVVFTSGATEGARVLRALSAGRDVIVEATSHDCLWSQRHMTGQADAILATGLANGETGVVVETQGAAGDWSAPGGRSAGMLMLDVVQAVGRLPFAFSWSGADLALVSAHKIGGPKGVGALIVRQGVEIPPLQGGGGQELGRRSGTENVAGIAGFAAAARAALADLEAGVWAEVARLRNILEETLVAEASGTILIGRDSGKDGARLPNTSCLATPGWKGETQVMQLDLAGFAISAGSACSSGKVRESRVLRAMGLDDATASSAIRVSLGPATTEDEVRRFCETWLDRERKFRARAA